MCNLQSLIVTGSHPWVPWFPLNTHIHLLTGISELLAWARPSLGLGMQK